jgi:Domain of unknown function (DUF4261)
MLRNTVLFVCFLGFFGQILPAQSDVSMKVITGTVLLNDRKAPAFKQILSAFPKNWLIKTDSLVITDKTAVFSTPGATVMLAWLDYKVNPAELQPAAGISWLWKNAEAETSKHQSQLVISVLGDPKNTVELYRLFTRTAAATLAETTTSTGVFMNSQYLLLSKGYYLEVARNMGAQDLPLYCWVYFGVLQNEDKSSGYSYGMTEFGLDEIEIVQSALPLQDSHALLYETAQAAVRAGKKWTSGEVISLSDNKKITIRRSKAQLIGEDTETIKIEQ